MIKKRGTKLADEVTGCNLNTYQLNVVLCKQASGLREVAPGVTDWRKINMVEEIWYIGVARNIVK